MKRRRERRVFDELADLVAFWQEELLLQDWTVKLGYTRNRRAPTATCLAWPEYGHAIVTINLRKLPPWQKDATVAHELLHCYVEPLARFAYRWAGKNRDRKDDVRRAEEGLTEALTRMVLALARRPWVGSAPLVADSATPARTARRSAGSSGRTPKAARIPRAEGRTGTTRAGRAGRAGRGRRSGM